MIIHDFVRHISVINNAPHAKQGGLVVPGTTKTCTNLDDSKPMTQNTLSQIAAGTFKEWNNDKGNGWKEDQKVAFEALALRHDFEWRDMTETNLRLLLGKLNDSKDSAPQSELLDSGCTFVKSFYLTINRKQYDQAWKFLSPNFSQRIWGNDLARFECGYENFRDLRNLNTFSIELTTRDTMKIGAYYEDLVDIPKIHDLHDLRKLHLNNLDDFVNRLKAFRDTLIRSGIENSVVNGMEIIKLLFSDGSEYVTYTCNLPKEKSEELLGQGEEIRIKKLFSVKVVRLEGGGLAIDGINPIRTGYDNAPI